jgi:hypothetical protein
MPENFSSNRISRLQSNLIRAIPRLPNNRETQKLLEQKSLGEILIIYLNWVSRLVPARRRKVIIEPALTADKKWKSLSPNVKYLLEKVRQAQNLTPHLSLQAYRQGYCPFGEREDGSKDSWADKDFLLNVMGYHHFHLGMSYERAGHAKRTNDVLFAEVDRDVFSAVGFFNHSVFEESRDSLAMAEGRKKLWAIFESRSARGVPPGAMYVPYLIATSGHRVDHVMRAGRYANLIRTIDEKLDDKEYLSKIFQMKDRSAVSKLKPTWHLDYSDLGILDEKTRRFVVCERGRI